MIVILATAVVTGVDDLWAAAAGLGELLKGACQLTLLFYFNGSIMTLKNSHRNPWIAWRFLIAGISLGFSSTVSMILAILIGINQGNPWSMISAWLSLSSLVSTGSIVILVWSRIYSQSQSLVVKKSSENIHRSLGIMKDEGLPALAQLVVLFYFSSTTTSKKQYREVIFLNLLPSILYAITVISRSRTYYHPITLPKLSKRNLSIKGPKLSVLGLNNDSSKVDVTETVKSPTQTLVIQMRSETGVKQMQAISIQRPGDCLEDLSDPSGRSSSLENWPQDKFSTEFKHKSHLSDLDSMFDNHSFYSLQSNRDGSKNQIPKLLEEGKLEASLAVIKTNKSTIQADGDGYVIEEWPEIHMVKKIKLEPRASLLPSQRPRKLNELENDSLEDILSTPKPVKTSTPVLMELSDLRKNLVAPPPSLSSSSSRFRFSSPEFRSDLQSSRRPSSPSYIAQTALEEIRKLFPPKLHLGSISSRKASSTELGLIGESDNEEDYFWGRHKRAAKKSYLSSHFYHQPIKKGFGHHFEMKSRWKSNENQSPKNQQRIESQIDENDVYRALGSYRFGTPFESPPAVKISEPEETKSIKNDDELSVMITPTKDVNNNQEGLKRRRLTPVLETNQLIHRLATQSADNLLLGCGLDESRELNESGIRIKDWFERRPSAPVF